jgi:ribosomal protein S18 acetylase RimI-like enzyme
MSQGIKLIMSEIRVAKTEDFQHIWPIFKIICRAGNTFAQPTDIDKKTAYDYWMVQVRQSYVYEVDGQLLGSYYLKTNQQGGGSHVCNAAYIVSEQARGMGVASAMCKHSQAMALEMGYQYMQYNFVISSNASAVRLWQKMGFEIVGRLPEAFVDPQQGLVDALVMNKKLSPVGLDL